jgi:hypothetical protein
MTHLLKKVWGPATWTVIHASAASCDDAAAFATFLNTLCRVLPCAECRAHLRAYLERHPPEALVRDAQSASRFCYDLHNWVNAESGKAQVPPTLMVAQYDVPLFRRTRVGSSYRIFSMFKCSRPCCSPRWPSPPQGTS